MEGDMRQRDTRHGHMLSTKSSTSGGSRLISALVQQLQSISVRAISRKLGGKRVCLCDADTATQHSPYYTYVSCRQRWAPKSACSI